MSGTFCQSNLQTRTTTGTRTASSMTVTTGRRSGAFTLLTRSLH